MPSNEKPVHAKRAQEGMERLSFPVQGRLDFLRVGLSIFGEPVLKGMAEDEMVGWHHQLYGYEFEQAPKLEMNWKG